MQFIGVAWIGDDAAFQGFIDKHGLTFPNISDDPGAIFDRFGVPAQPALVVVSSRGDVQQLFGAVDESQVDSVLAAAVDN